MLPANSILVAATRWLDVLSRSNLTRAWSLILNDPRYGDLTRAQYHGGLSWLLANGLLDDLSDIGPTPASSLRDLGKEDTAIAVMAAALESTAPSWLADSDTLVSSASDLPQDAESLAEALGMSDTLALVAIRRAQRKVDLEARRRYGLVGELSLVELLEDRWPGSTTHVSATDDTAGYDIAFRPMNRTWHLEVKSTNRRGRLVIYVSRHEYETAQSDPHWRLVVLGLDASERLAVITTARTEVFALRAPRNIDARMSWESSKCVLNAEDLDAGLHLDQTLLAGTFQQTQFAWFPSSTSND